MAQSQLDRGDNFDRLVKLIGELENYDPNWAIAGNAGVDSNYSVVTKSCYVIDFHLTHLSPGNANADFWKVQSEFYQKWCKDFVLFYVKTTMGVEMCLSKYKILRYIGSHKLTKPLLFK